MTDCLERVTLTTDDIERLHALYDQGLCLQAYETAKARGPLRAWTGTAAQLIGGRLAINLGAPRLCRYLHFRAWRTDRTHPEARYYHARLLFERWGPLPTWRYLQTVGEMPEATPELRADWSAFHANVVGNFRDFNTAEKWLVRAEQLAPERPWICVERSALLEAQDRFVEALAAAERSLVLRPWFRPGIQRVAYQLLLLDREQEALELLTAADRHIESAPVVAQLAALQTELGHYHDARRSYDRFAELSPLRETPMDRWLTARRSDTAYYDGDFTLAAAWARQLNEDFWYTELARRLADEPDRGSRVSLSVPFVRQHHLTCAPATLAALTRFWQMPADHLEVAAEICYDGTPDHSERHWAETHGWEVREFTVTWESAVALLDRGVPFTLTIVEPTFSHLQAAIGYDSRRGTLLIRDPNERHRGEVIADAFLDRCRAYGPRGMALVPGAKAHFLDGLDLPDAPLYDHLYQLRRAIYQHDRSAAQAAYDALRALAPAHRLTWHARWDLARYDGNPVEGLACANGLLDLYPDTTTLQLAKLTFLRDQVHRQERVAFLEEICSKRFPHPAFLLQYAQVMRDDARELPHALLLMRRALRSSPHHAPNYFVFGNLLADQRRHAEALELYRIAACLDDYDEQFAQVYFNTARQLRQTDTALRHLQDRFAQFGGKSSQPAKTLYWAYSDQELMPEAFAVLDEALKRKPDDGDLQRFVAEENGRHGRFAEAARLLALSRGKCPPGSWLRSAAMIAVWQGERQEALARWREVLALEPLALDAHRSIVQLLVELDGRAAALDHLRDACERFPHHLGLCELRVQWLRDEGPAAVEPVVRQLVDMHPTNAWAHRELAMSLAALGRRDEAFAALDRAAELDPMEPALYNVRGRLCALAGRLAEARDAYRKAVRLSVDSDHAIARWIELCETLAERRAALEFIRRELVRQVTFGDGLLAFRQHAQYTLEPDELLAVLREGWTQRPDLWHAWSALIRQLTDMEKLEEAHDLAKQSVERFPMLPRIWVDLAGVCRARADSAGEIAALEEALRISPGWGFALRTLAEAHERAKNHAAARQCLETAVNRAPLDASSHGCLADTLWQLGEKDAALDRLRRSLDLDPGYDWAWGRLRAWTEELKKLEEAVAFARELAERRSTDVQPWLELARCLHASKNGPAALEALDKALTVEPHNSEVRDFKAELLTHEKRFDEALAVCGVSSANDGAPLLLRGRAAWVEAERGGLPQAITRMREVLKEDPNYYWGWRNLADWLNQNKDYTAYREAAEHLVRLAAPDNPVSYAYLGEAKLLTRDRAGAKEAFQKAIAIDPSYGYAGMSLFDEQLADGELPEAAQTLESLQEHIGGEYVIARTIQLAARREDKETALAELRRLCRLSFENSWPFEAALPALNEAGWSWAAERELWRSMAEPEVNPQVGRVWAIHRTVLGDFKLLDRIGELLPRGEVGMEALRGYVERLRVAKDRPRLKRCLRRYGDVLTTNTRDWGRVGYVWRSLDLYREAAAWLADWAERDGLEAWMLSNLASSLRILGRDAEARPVSERAVTLPEDETTPFHRLGLVVDDVLASRTEAAAEGLAKLAAETLDAYDAIIYELVAGLLRLERAQPGDRRADYVDVRRRLHAVVQANRRQRGDSTIVTPDVWLRRLYRRVAWRMARMQGGWLRTLWCFARLWRWL